MGTYQATQWHVCEATSEAPVVPPVVDVSELLARRKREYESKAQRHAASALVPIRVRVDGPFGIVHFGDPHVDDDGTDVAMLEEHTRIVRETPALFAGNVGDTTNNWVGRLARLYGEQSTSATEAWALAEWFVSRCQWLYMVSGNHDHWSGAGDPLQWIAQGRSVSGYATNVRLELLAANGRSVRVNVRHDFAGTSQWNPVHGAAKAFQVGTRDHVMVCGHKHVSGYMPIKDPSSGIIGHCIQVASYKRLDRYAQERGFRDQMISPCAVTVIDPDASEAELVHVFWEPAAAADYLTWLRQRQRK
jgi:hypothetical protein